jgi:hypothetical protein
MTRFFEFIKGMAAAGKFVYIIDTCMEVTEQDIETVVPEPGYYLAHISTIENCKQFVEYINRGVPADKKDNCVLAINYPDKLVSNCNKKLISTVDGINLLTGKPVISKKLEELDTPPMNILLEERKKYKDLLLYIQESGIITYLN